LDVFARSEIPSRPLLAIPWLAAGLPGVVCGLSFGERQSGTAAGERAVVVAKSPMKLK